MGLFNKDATTEEKLDYLITLFEEQNQYLRLIQAKEMPPRANKFSVPEIAAYIGFSTTYVYRFIENGLLKSFASGEKAQAWTTKEEMDRFILEDLPNYNWGKNEYRGKAMELYHHKLKVEKIKASKKSKAA